MDCEKVREQFSSLLEGDLKPPEDEKIREHLRSCEGCQKEWEQFNRMMSWLHTVEEEEVPEGFLSEVQKKLEERKGRQRWGRAQFFRSARIPLQAAAMVGIVFLALYLTKMAPFEMLQKRAVERPEIAESSREKKESILKEDRGQKEILPPLANHRKNDVSEAKPSVTDEKAVARDSAVQELKEKDKGLPAPPLKEEMASPKEMAKAEAPRSEEKEREPEGVGTVKMSIAKKAAREITLKISDREKAFGQIQELTKKMGGEIVIEDGDVLLASLPVSSYMEFEKELTKIGLPSSAPLAVFEQEMKGDLRPATGAKGKGLVSIRIRLVVE